LVDGFGAVLSGSDEPAPTVALSALPRGETPVFEAMPVVPLVEVTLASMPRLWGSLRPTLDALGAQDVRIFLNATGGVEAYLFSPTELALGAGALDCFGPQELAYLCALALALGDRGVELGKPGTSVEMELAGSLAFQAVPSSIAAGRVLARLDVSVRGADPSTVDVKGVLEKSRAFHAVAQTALHLV
jgi:hypothetical protein